MTTAVVVTTIVSHDSSETSIVDQLFEQICAKDRDLRNALAKLGLDARVTSAIVNIGDGINQESLIPRQAETPAAQTTSAEMDELEFMDYLLEQIQQGGAPRYARLNNDELSAMADEKVGEHLSQNPFLY
ncbi:MAG TPA: hypothetical protein PKE45_12105 [Caldilineaceae bacterium]|nr:hypothetical protein [Caldilineaceae bacterium]